MKTARAPLHLLLFGQIGSGKSHLGELLARECGFHHHDADQDLPPAIVAAIRRHEPFTEAMRDDFVSRIHDRVAWLTREHPRFVVSQALFKERHRARLHIAFPDLHFVWVRSTPELIAARLETRVGYLASAYYAQTVNPSFEPPALPHLVVDNVTDPARLQLDLVRLLTAAPKLARPTALSP
jgi:gluconate kinase